MRQAILRVKVISSKLSQFIHFQGPEKYFQCKFKEALNKSLLDDSMYVK